jgi:hypothetical protein
MAFRVVLALLGLLLLVAVPAAAQHPLEAPLRVQLARQTQIDAGGPNGRLMPDSGVATIRFEFQVGVPQGAYCLTPQVRMTYQTKAPAFAQAHVAPATETRDWAKSGGGPVALVDGENVAGYSTTLRVTLAANAPAFGTVPIDLVVQAWPLSPSPACNFAPSAPYHLALVLIADYVPRLEVQAAAEPWTGEGFLLEAANRGNGDSRLGFALGTPGGGWVPSPETRILETRLNGESAPWKNRFVLGRLDAPSDWTGDVLVSMTSVVSVDGLLKDQVVVHLGRPPPIAYADDPEPQDVETSEPDIESLPGWGGFGTVIALSLVGLLRRVR